MNNRFSENLKKIRKENNLSQEQLADELGVSRQAISKWESAVAYPEMDKIIALCDKFNLNIDDLLHKDIKEIKGEEESKKKINIIVDDFLKFITNTINLLSNMSTKSKIKCIFEQIIIAFILFFISMFLNLIIGNIFSNIVSFLPDKAYIFIINILNSILTIALLIISIVIIIHIFKIRYLDYYEEIKKDINNNEEKDNNKILSKKTENKIIIRDPNHSEYKFINALFKFIISIIKFFLLLFGLFVAFILICLFASFITSFLVIKTGLFFLGLITTILSSSVIAIIILLLILNFVFNRKSNKKKIIWSFILSLVLFGIGCGLTFVGTLSFDIIDNNEKTLKTITKEYDMKDNLLLYPHSNYNIEYIKADNNNIKVEYSISKYCQIEEHYNKDNNNTITAWPYCNNPTKIIRNVIKNINNKEIIPLNNEIEKITIYTNQSNIDKLKNNYDNYLKEIEKENQERNNYENRINELENKNNELQQQVYDLEEKLNNKE